MVENRIQDTLPVPMKKQIIKNLFSNYLSNFLGLILGFFLVPFLIQKLGKDSFGLIVLAESSVAFFEIATIGVKMALSRYATFSLAQNKKEEFLEFLSTGRVILYGIAAVTFLVGAALSFNFPKIFTVPEACMEQSKILAFLLVVAFSISIPNIVYWSVLYAKHRYDLINISYSSGLIFRGLCIFAVYSWLPARYISLTSYGLIYLAMVCGQNLAVFLWHKRVMPGIEIGLRHFNGAKVREICSFGSYSTLSRVNTLLYQNTANIMINIFWGPLYNTIYSIAQKFPSIMARLFSEASYSLTSTFNELVAKNDHERMRRLFFSSTKMLVVATAPICVLLALFSEKIIHLWVGPEFQAAAALLPVLMVPLFLQIPLSVSGCLMNSYGRVKIPSLVGLVNALLNVGLGIILGRFFSLGLAGIAIAASAIQVAHSLFFSPYYVCKIAGIPLGGYLKEALGVPLLWACVMTLGGFFILKSVVIPHTNQSLLWILSATAMAIIYMFGTFLLILNADERSQIIQALKTLTASKQSKSKSVLTPAIP